MRRNQIRRQRQEAAWLRAILGTSATEAMSWTTAIGVTHPDASNDYPTEDEVHPLQLVIPSTPYPTTVHVLPVRLVSVGVGADATQAAVATSSILVAGICWRWLQPYTPVVLTRLAGSNVFAIVRPATADAGRLVLSSSLGAAGGYIATADALGTAGTDYTDTPAYVSSSSRYWVGAPGETVLGQMVPTEGQTTPTFEACYVAPYGNVRRFKLKTAMAPCGSADCYALGGAGVVELGTDYDFSVYDTLGILPSAMPAGTTGWARWMADTEKWELVSYGTPCGSESSISDSLPPSESDMPPSDSSAPPSESSAPPSESSAPPSESSAPPSESSAPPSESWSGSDKSSAIVPASWSPTGYVALFIHEMPEVRFDDVLAATVAQEDQDVRIDPHFVEVCTKGTIEVCGVSVDKPVVVGARAMKDVVRLQFGTQNPKQAVRVVIRLTGIRRGFAGKRFPRRTHAQFVANERFINSAYPSDPKAE